MAGPEERVRGYAQALFAIAEAEGVLERVEDELYRFARVVEREHSLREALTDPALLADRKKAVLQDLLGNRANPHTVSTLGFIVDQGRTRDLSRIIEELARLAAERRQRAVAEVRTAIPLDEQRRERLAAALSKATGKNVELKVLVDPSVMGGAVARVGDQVIDGTIRRRLELAQQRLGSV